MTECRRSSETLVTAPANLKACTALSFIMQDHTYAMRVNIGVAFPSFNKLMKDNDFERE